ncbi:GNAT family N-acetyltransferase [Herbaspirillum hiltneri]|nr:GNAT family N-acetyltransferase [Herbaspirillum hiltneri]
MTKTEREQNMNHGVRNGVAWRAMQESDLPAVTAIAAEVHPDYPESPAVFVERLRLFAAGCLIAADANGTVLGYAIAHPAVLGQPPALDSLLGELPPQADCLYLHDVALTEATRQSGLGGALVGYLRELAFAQGFACAALMAVNNSAAYWRRHSFISFARVDAALAKKIASYGSDAQYLVSDTGRQSR